MNQWRTSKPTQDRDLLVKQVEEYMENNRFILMIDLTYSIFFISVGRFIIRAEVFKLYTLAHQSKSIGLVLEVICIHFLVTIRYQVSEIRQSYKLVIARGIEKALIALIR